MSNEQDLARWVGRAQAGDRAAFGALVRHFERRVYGFVHRMIVNPDIASELSQDVFLKAFERLSSFDASAAFEPWLLRIARNRVYDYLRRQRINVVASDPDAGTRTESHLMRPDRRAEQRAVGTSIERALAKLSDDYRESVVLRLIHGLSFAEVGEVTGQTEGAAKARFVRARLQLRELLKDEAPGQ